MSVRLPILTLISLVATLLLVATLCVATAGVATATELPATWKADLFAAREAAWQSYFGDPEALAAMLTDDFVAIDRGSHPFSSKAVVVAESRQVTANGLRLAEIRFPDNVVQLYGDVAILYTTFVYTLSENGEAREPVEGRGTELFRWDGKRWLHTGWHLGPPAQ